MLTMLCTYNNYYKAGAACAVKVHVMSRSQLIVQFTQTKMN